MGKTILLLIGTIFFSYVAIAVAIKEIKAKWTPAQLANAWKWFLASIGVLVIVVLIGFGVKYMIL